jgi:ABC-type transport system involved in cytochrome bd biosynthesis fused ATPase/permease subunit
MTVNHILNYLLNADLGSFLLASFALIYLPIFVYGFILGFYSEDLENIDNTFLYTIAPLVLRMAILVLIYFYLINVISLLPNQDLFAGNLIVN